MYRCCILAVLIVTIVVSNILMTPSTSGSRQVPDRYAITRLVDRAPSTGGISLWCIKVNDTNYVFARGSNGTVTQVMRGDRAELCD